jgi:hypothetical protein
MSGSSAQYIVNEKGQKTAVVLDIKEYEELLEDLHDIAIVAERRDEPTLDLEILKTDSRQMDSFKILWKTSAERDLRNIDVQ